MNPALPPLPNSPLVVNTQSHTPRFWENESVLFIANLMAMFFGNEEETRLLQKEVVGWESYGGRLLPILGLLFPGGDNLLVLESEPDRDLAVYFGGDLGLLLPRVGLLSHSDYLALGEAMHLNEALPCAAVIEKWRGHPSSAVDAFVTDAIISKLARLLGKRTLSSPAGSKIGNNKLRLHLHMEQAGLPVFETRVAHTPEEVPDFLRELAGRGYDRAVIKSPIGASGIGLMKVDTLNRSVRIPELYFHEGACMVQGWLRPGLHGIGRIHSPSVQMFLNHDAVHLYDLTEQILSEDSVHQGNESPPPYLEAYPGLTEELFAQAGVAGSWLYDQGYRGTASVDFLVTALPAPGSYRVYACEINARVTGATYPSVLGRHYLPRGAWLMRNLQLAQPLSGAEVLGQLDRHGHLFHPYHERGILPINFNLTSDGLVNKGQFLCLGTSAGACHDLLSRAEQDLPIDWRYVRD